MTEIELYQIKSVSLDLKYYIDKNGNVYGPKKNKLKPRMGGYKKKYCRFGAKVNGKTKDFYIHRIMLQEFIGMPEQGMEAAHLDGNPQNNKIENLKWVTPYENSQHKIMHGTSGKGQSNSMAKISDHHAQEIVIAYKNMSSKELSERYKISTTSVSGIATGRIRHNITNKKHYEINKKIANQRILECLKYGSKKQSR